MSLERRQTEAQRVVFTVLLDSKSITCFRLHVLSESDKRLSLICAGKPCYSETFKPKLVVGAPPLPPSSPIPSIPSRSLISPSSFQLLPMRLNFEAGFGSVTSTIIFEILHCCRLCNLRYIAYGVRKYWKLSIMVQMRGRFVVCGFRFTPTVYM